MVDKCLYKPQQRMVAVKRLKQNVVKNKADVEALKMEIALLKKLQNRWEGRGGAGEWGTASASLLWIRHDYKND